MNTLPDEVKEKAMKWNLAIEWAARYKTGEWFEKLRIEAFIAGWEEYAKAYAPVPSEDADEKEVMMQAFGKVQELFNGRSWIMDGRGSYPYNEDRYRQEVRYMYDEFEEIQNDTWKNIKSKSFEYREKIIAEWKAKQAAPVPGKEESALAALKELCERYRLLGLSNGVLDIEQAPAYISAQKILAASPSTASNEDNFDKYDTAAKEYDYNDMMRAMMAMAGWCSQIRMRDAIHGTEAAIYAGEFIQSIKPIPEYNPEPKAVQQAAKDWADKIFEAGWSMGTTHRYNSVEKEKQISEILAGASFNSDAVGWLKEKPVFNKECVFITATKYTRNTEDLHWDYSIWQIKKLDADLDGNTEGGNYGWYWGLLNGDGEEWGDLADLTADRYLIIETKNSIQQAHDKSTYE